MQKKALKSFFQRIDSLTLCFSVKTATLHLFRRNVHNANSQSQPATDSRPERSLDVMGTTDERFG